LTVARQFQEGFVTANGVLHAAQRTLDGLCAVCGAGRILQLLPGRFDPEDRRACPECAGLEESAPVIDLRLV
jgi:hypothetical protein